MSLIVLGIPRKQRTDRGWRVTGRAQFVTTSLTGELPIDAAADQLRGPIALTLLNGPSHVMNIPTGTIATSGTTTFNIVMPYAGIITGWSIVSGAAQAAHSTIVFDWHVINKGLAASGTAVVIDRTTAGNTLDSDVDAAAASLAAFIPRALTLTSTTADKTVVKGDVLNFVWTAAGSTPTSQVGTSAIITVSSDGSTGDERIWVDEASLINSSNGYCAPAYNSSASPPGKTVTVNRFSTNPRSGAYFNYSYEW